MSQYKMHYNKSFDFKVFKNIKPIKELLLGHKLILPPRIFVKSYDITSSEWENKIIVIEPKCRLEGIRIEIPW